MRVKILSITLSAVIIFTMLFSCNTKKEENVNKSEENDSQTSELQTTTGRIMPDLPETDFENNEFTFLTAGPGYGFGYYEVIDLYEENPSDDPFRDSIYKRNLAVQEKYNVVIKEIKSDSVQSQAQKAIKSGDDTYDAVMTSMYESSVLAQSKLLADIRSIEYIDLSKPWWDKNAENELSIAGKTYFTTGEISVMDNACTRLLIFNKKLAKDFNLENPYDYVKNDKWTLEAYSNMLRQVKKDVNGNGETDDEDIYGTIMEDHNPLYLVRGFGERLTTNDANGIPKITFMTDRMIDSVNKIWDVYFDDTLCRNVRKVKKTADFSNEFTYARSLFANDKFLFHLAGPLILTEFRNMESEFGLLPSPKYEETQSRYYHVVDPEAAMLSIPITNTDKKTGVLIEAMAAESMYTITPQYNEILLKRKLARDSESEFVLDIINETRTYDLCTMFSWGGLNFTLNELTANQNRNIASRFEKVIISAQTAIDKTIAIFEGE